MATVGLVHLGEFARQRFLDARGRVGRVRLRRLGFAGQVTTDLLEAIEHPLQLRVGLFRMPAVRL
ncbi:hypothetical protein, partial [Nocardia tenerifensis]|uniref:hypothetical protein n=1 Tax=Nocardia tenerifensis TaxID=228006 RepID=UPI00059293F8